MRDSTATFPFFIGRFLYPTTVADSTAEIDIGDIIFALPRRWPARHKKGIAGGNVITETNSASNYLQASYPLVLTHSPSLRLAAFLQPRRLKPFDRAGVGSPSRLHIERAKRTFFDKRGSVMPLRPVAGAAFCQHTADDRNPRRGRPGRRASGCPP